MSKKIGKPYSKKEIEYLREVDGVLGYAEIAKVLKRTADGVKHKIVEIRSRKPTPTLRVVKNKIQKAVDPVKIHSAQMDAIVQKYEQQIQGLNANLKVARADRFNLPLKLKMIVAGICEKVVRKEFEHLFQDVLEIQTHCPDKELQEFVSNLLKENPGSEELDVVIKDIFED
jgi:hypothetical protein